MLRKATPSNPAKTIQALFKMLPFYSINMDLQARLDADEMPYKFPDLFTDGGEKMLPDFRELLFEIWECAEHEIHFEVLAALSLIDDERLGEEHKRKFWLNYGLLCLTMPWPLPEHLRQIREHGAIQTLQILTRARTTPEISDYCLTMLEHLKQNPIHNKSKEWAGCYGLQTAIQWTCLNLAEIKKSARDEWRFEIAKEFSLYFLSSNATQANEDFRMMLNSEVPLNVMQEIFLHFLYKCCKLGSCDMGEVEFANFMTTASVNLTKFVRQAAKYAMNNKEKCFTFPRFEV